MAAARASKAKNVPGVVAFAAVVLIVLGGLHVIYGIGALFDNNWALDTANGIADDNLWIWGIIDAAIGVILIFAGISLYAGQAFGRWVAIIWAILAAIRWLYWIPAAPILSIVAIIIAMTVLYAATVYPEHFQKAAR